MHAPREDSQPWYKQFWPWFLISIPAGTVVAAMITLSLAIDSNDGLVRDEYYKEGLAIHKDAAQVDSARGLGITAQLQLDPSGGQVLVQLNDAAIGTVEQLTLSVNHPTRPNRDQQVLLKRTTPGHYVGELAGLEDANWKLSVSPPSGPWRITGRLAVPQQHSAALE
jgi:hypothetical protein